MKLTIDKKITLFIVCVIISLATILGFYLLREQQRSLSSELDERVSVLLGNLAFNLEYPVLVGDDNAIARLVAGVMAQRDIVSCRITGMDGKLIYDKGTPSKADTREFQAAIAVKKAAGSQEELILGIPGQAEEKIGRVYLMVSLSGLTGKISRVQNTVAVLFAVVTAISVLGAYLFIRHNIGTPVARLVKATGRISSGDLEHRVIVERKDEMGVLADSFNKMTASLQAAREELVHREKLSMLGLIAEGIGNELRNPLGVINNATFYLKAVTDDGGGKIREYLGIIEQEVENSLMIISDLLDFVQIRSPRKGKVVVKVLIGECLDKCAVPARIGLNVAIPAEMPPIMVDQRQMGQVFRNIIINAIQAMPQEGTLTISAKYVQGPAYGAPRGKEPQGELCASISGREKNFVEVSIADSGAGITAENMKKLFHPLFTTKSRGLGLGLASAKNLTEANGGHIYVESRPGEGAVFTVALPVAASKRQKAEVKRRKTEETAIFRC